MWRKCRKPEEWVCDRCGDCGGCNECDPQVMYHDGDYSLCSKCFQIELAEITEKITKYDSN